MLIYKNNPERIALPEGGSKVPFPFIVGAPRSGTSLLTQMLDTHPDLAIPLETHYFPQVVERCRLSSDPRATFLEVLRSHYRWASFQIDDRKLDEEVARIEPFDVGAGLRAFYRQYSQLFNKPRWGDKTPPNVMRMRLIQEVLPEARFVHIIRDGRDVALSVRHMSFGPKTFSDAAQWWVLQLWRARGQVEDLRSYMELRYEDLVTEPEPTLRRVCEFVELPWNPRMLTYYEHFDRRLAEVAMGGTLPEHDRVEANGRAHHNELLAKPPQSDRIGVWQREMAAEDVREFEEIASDGLREFGYPLVASANAESATRLL